MTLDAHLLYVILNIHAAASDESPASPAPAPISLPGPSSLLGGMVSGNLSQYLYTLSDLRSDRANLNGSWYSVSETYRPVEEYYSIDVNENGIHSTEDGWPSEGYLEFSKSKRLLVGWGTIDPQMAGYNFTGDSGVIFPTGFLQNVQADVTASSAGRLTSGCFLGNLTDDLTQIHSSWAFDAILPGFDYPTGASSGMWATSFFFLIGAAPIQDFFKRLQLDCWKFAIIQLRACIIPVQSGIALLHFSWIHNLSSIL
jgi:hypothetical protein